MPKSTYLLDDRLVPRIKQILRSCKNRPSVSYLTEELQTQFGEYARKKKNAVVKSVEKGLAIALKELQKEGIHIATRGTSSSESEADYEADQYKNKNIMNDMINNMYKQGQAATPTSGQRVINPAHVASASPSADSQRKSSKLSGAQAESNSLQGRESLRWCIDRKSNTGTPAEKMELDGSHYSSGNLAEGSNHVGSGDGDGLNDTNVENTDSAKSRQPKKRRRESPDGRTRKKQKQTVVYPDVTFSNVGGNESVLQHLKKRCHFLKHPEFLSLMQGLPRSFLFHGPTGCGKSLLAKSIAGEYKVPMLSVTASELVGGISGDSEANIRDLFNQAAELAPCILLIDDVDAIATKRETATKGMESRVVTQLSSSMDDLKSKDVPVLMICTTNRPNSLDEAFRRTGRFDLEFALRFPNRDARKSILQTLCHGIPLAENVSLSAIADLTPGYVGSDLKALVLSTNACALNRAMSEHLVRKQTPINCENTNEGSLAQNVEFTHEDIYKIDVARTMADFQEAMTEVKPTAKQEDVILIPDTTWEDIGGLDNIRDKLNLCIMERTRRPELYKASGMRSSLGVLLVGPPGCGKTSVAKAVANEAGINFLYVKGPELFNKYVGESEKNVRELFKRAGSLAPCVIFFDEIDSLCSKRSSGGEDGSASRITNQLLLEMSGLEQRTEVYVIAATNKLDCLDPALLRPGRMDKIIYVGLPSPEGRVEILKALTKNGLNPKLADDVDLDSIGKDIRCDGFSGADLGNLVQVAIEACVEEIIRLTDAAQSFVIPVVHKHHFETAFENESVRASVEAEAKKNYGAVKRRLENKTTKKAGNNADSRSDEGPSMDLA